MSLDVFVFSVEYIYLALCFEKNNMKTSFTHGVGKPVGLGNLPSSKQSPRKPLPLRKIACVSTLNADTPPTVMHQASISKLLASSINSK